MANDPVFGQEFLEECTAQAEIRFNELVVRLGAALVKVNSYGDTAPPGAVNGDSYVIGTGATGPWSGQDGKIAVYLDGWLFMDPTEGMRVRVADLNTSIEYDGAAWVSSGGGGGHQTLTDGANIAWPTFQGRSAQVTLQGNRNMLAPGNLVDGATYVLHVIQDGVGSRTLTWNAVFKWSGGSAPTLTTSAGGIDVFTFVARGGNLYGATHGLDYA